MRLTEIRLHNFRGIEDLTLDLIHPDGGPLTVAAIVGPNGSGKSSILAAVSGILTAQWGLYGGSTPTEGDRRFDFQEAAISLRARDVIDDREIDFGMSIMSGGSGGWKSVSSDIDLRPWLDALDLPGPGTAGLVLGFDAHRLVPPLDVDAVNPRRVTSNARWNSLAPSLRRDATMWFRFGHLEQWLVNLDHLRARARADAGRTLPLWDLVREGLDAILDPVRFDGVDDALQVRFRTPRGVVPLRALSDGFKSVFVVVAELILRLSLAAEDPYAVFDLEAVCLVDEIDAHLHPRWQGQILRGLQKLFPRVQFIVTTHSPYVVASLAPHEVFVLGDIAP